MIKPFLRILLLLFVAQAELCGSDLNSIYFVQNKSSSLKPILDNKAQIKLPESFELMSSDKIALKYPMVERRPSEVYSNKSGSINIAFNHTRSEASIEELPQIRDVLGMQIKKSTIDFIGSKIQAINGQDFAIFQFVSPAANANIYNLMFVTVLENRLLIGTFNCTTNLREEWEPIGKQIVSSMVITP